MSNSYNPPAQQWGQQYPPPRLQLEHEYDFTNQQDPYQFNPEAFQSNSRQSSSYTPRTGHSPSASIDSSLYASQNFQGYPQAPAFLTPDQREYHNNPATYNFQAATSPTPITATGLSAITTNVAAAAAVPARSPAQQSYYLPRSGSSQPGPQPKVKRQRVPEPINEPKDDDMEPDMEEEGGARAKPYVCLIQCCSVS